MHQSKGKRVVGIIDHEDELRFRQALRQFWASKGIAQMKIPQIGGQELDMLKLYRSVCRRGGGQAVSNHKLWKEIVDEFGLPSSCTSASFTLKNHYQRYLLAYEQKFYFGKEDDAELPQLVAGRARKKHDDSKDFRYGGITRPISQREDNQKNLAELEAELAKYYDKTDKSQQMLFLRRSKMYPHLADLKRVYLGLLSQIPSQVTFAINVLVLYSNNTHIPFKFEQYPNILDALGDVLSAIVPYKTVTELETLRSLTLLLRNLCLTQANQKPLLGSKLLAKIQQLLRTSFDRECTKNILDIMSVLSRVGLDPKPAIPKIFQHLVSERSEDVEIAADFVRALAEDKHPSVQDIIISNKQVFVSILMSPNSETREMVVEIFNIVSTQQWMHKLFASDFKFLTRILALVSSGTKNQRTSEMAAEILVNMCNSAECRTSILHFQKDLAVILCSSSNMCSSVNRIMQRLFD